MADPGVQTPTARRRLPMILGGVVLVGLILTAWLWATAGHESTDDAQVESHVTQISARVGGTVRRVLASDNQLVESGAVLMELDPRDYQVAVDKARAELADAQAAATAAESDVPITSTTTSSNLTTARSGLEQAQSAITTAQREVEAARARFTTAEARLREAEANAAKAQRDVERLKGLLAKDEVSRQQYETVVAVAEAQRAAADSAKSQVAEAEAGVHVAESKLAQSNAAERQAQAGVRGAQTAPEQIAGMRARLQSAQARVQQAASVLAQAELNLEYTVIKAPARGVLSKKDINPGQVVQPGQPLTALVETDSPWIVANFKETQLANLRAGQPATIRVDAFGGREFKGHVDSIAPATGARFSLLPPENATGNFVKVVQRVPVKIVLDAGQDPDHQLRPGMSVVPTVNTR